MNHKDRIDKLERHVASLLDQNETQAMNLRMARDRINRLLAEMAKIEGCQTMRESVTSPCSV